MSVWLTGSPCSGGIVRVLCTLTLERDSDSCHPALPPGTSFPVWSSSSPSFLSCSQLPPFSGCHLLSPPRASSAVLVTAYPKLLLSTSGQHPNFTQCHTHAWLSSPKVLLLSCGPWLWLVAVPSGWVPALPWHWLLLFSKRGKEGRADPSHPLLLSPHHPSTKFLFFFSE